MRPLILFSAAVLTVAGGFLFGPVAGTALVVLAGTGSAMVAYEIARRLGAGALADPSATGRFAVWGRRLQRRRFETVLVMRLVFLPFDLVSYLAGAGRIRLGAFVAGTVVGSAPATVAFVLFGASMESFDGGVPSINTPVLVASVALLVAGLAIAPIRRRRDAARDVGY